MARSRPGDAGDARNVPSARVTHGSTSDVDRGPAEHRVEMRRLKGRSARVIEDRRTAGIGADDLDRCPVDRVAAAVDDAPAERSGADERDARLDRRGIGQQHGGARDETRCAHAQRRCAGRDRAEPRPALRIRCGFEWERREAALGQHHPRRRDPLGIARVAVGDPHAHPAPGRERQHDGFLFAASERDTELDARHPVAEAGAYGVYARQEPPDS